jgi:hypothetical protein
MMYVRCVLLLFFVMYRVRISKRSEGNCCAIKAKRLYGSAAHLTCQVCGRHVSCLPEMHMAMDHQ